MWQPRSSSQFYSLKGRFSMPTHYTTEGPEAPRRSQSRRLSEEKKVSGSLSADPMDIDSGALERNSLKEGQQTGTFLEDEELVKQFEIVNHETVGETPFYSHPNNPLESSRDLNGTQPHDPKTRESRETEPVPDVPSNAEKPLPREDAAKVVTQEKKEEAMENTNLQLEFQQLRSEYEGKMSILGSKITNLETSALRQPSTTESAQKGEDVGLSPSLKQKYEERIRTLERTQREAEEQIHSLLNSQEPVLKYQSELEVRYRAAVNHIEKQRREREENDLNLRSEITAVRGNYQKEKERAQKLMKTMAEMQSADPFKMDNTSITSSVRELRYDIKNWARAQKLVPSLPAQGLISTISSRALGGKEKGPNYEFLKDITPAFHEYTESSQDFRLLLQAYVWKRIVELVFYDDLWAGTRKPIDDDETEHRLQTGYLLMKQRLAPDDENNSEYITQFHEWRSNTARLLSQRVSPERRARTISKIRDDILRPLHRAAEPMEQELRNVEDLEGVIESAMRLGALMAQQRAFITFEFVSPAAYGKMEFRAQNMTDPFPPPEHFDQRSHMRTVLLNLAPRLLKHGSSEGTGFDSCVQLLEAEVETRVVPRRFATRRPGF